MRRSTLRTLCLGFGLALIAFAVVWTTVKVAQGKFGDAAIGLVGILVTTTLFGFVRDLTAEQGRGR